MSLINHFHALLDPLLRHTPSSILRYPPNQSPFHPTQPDSSVATEMKSLPAPIIGLLTPTPHALSTFLLERGFIVRPVVPPTVPPGEERVRVCLRSGIEKTTIASLVDALRQWVESQQEQQQQPVHQHTVPRSGVISGVTTRGDGTAVRVKAKL